jgi:hypothetical protein
MLDKALARVVGLLQNVQVKMAGVAGGFKVGGVNVAGNNMVVQTSAGGTNSGLDMHQQVAMSTVGNNDYLKEFTKGLQNYVAAQMETLDINRQQNENLKGIKESVSNVNVGGSSMGGMDLAANIIGNKLTGGMMQDMPNIGNGMGRSS